MHIDHLLGIIPLLRYIMQQHRMKRYNGKLNIYCDNEIKEIIDTFMSATFHKVHLDLYKELVIYNFCKDYKKFSIIGYDIEVIDLHEAFCLEKEETIFKAREKNHSIAKDVAETMETLNIMQS